MKTNATAITFTFLLDRSGFMLRRQFLATLPGVSQFLALPPRPQPEPLDDPEWLRKFQSAIRTPVWESDDSVVRHLVSAIQGNRAITIRYFGGTDPGTKRRISPSLVFTAEGFPAIYLSAWCHDRKAERVFRIDCLELA